jgi:3-dehydroquinate dehydratase-2
MAKLLLLQGPNLNLLGTRETNLYGKTSLDDINRRSEELAKQLGHELCCYQSNAEHEVIDAIHQAPHNSVDFIIINPAAWTHTSIALRDALLASQIPFIELHLSNIYARETFRHHSYLADIANGVICGFGPFGYEMALYAANHYLNTKS